MPERVYNVYVTVTCDAQDICKLAAACEKIGKKKIGQISVPATVAPVDIPGQRDEKAGILVGQFEVFACVENPVGQTVYRAVDSVSFC